MGGLKIEGPMYKDIGGERVQKGDDAWTYAKAFGFILSVICTIG